MTDGIGIRELMCLNPRKIEKKRLRRIKSKYKAKPLNDKEIVGGGQINFRRDFGNYISPTMLRWFLQSRVNLGNDAITETLTNVSDFIGALSMQPTQEATADVELTNLSLIHNRRCRRGM